MQPVLVVDDDCDIRATVRLLLEYEGYRVSEACDGQEALEALRCAPGSMVMLLDLNMPIMDGRQVLATLAQDSDLAARHRVIVVSAYADQPMPEAALALVRAHDIPFIRKPFELEDLLDHVARASEHMRAAMLAH